VALLWASVQRIGKDKQPVYAACIGLTSALAHEVSNRLTASSSASALKPQVAGAVNAIATATKILLKETESPLREFLQ
jgi:hypothetical protein